MDTLFPEKNAADMDFAMIATRDSIGTEVFVIQLVLPLARQDRVAEPA